MDPGYTPESFSGLADRLNGQNLDWFVLSGQAVNLWAERYPSVLVSCFEVS